MTDKPTPTDAELKAMWQLHAADIGGILDFARAVLAKWGQPSGAGEPAEFAQVLQGKPRRQRMLKQELAPRGVGIPVLQGEEEVK